MSRSRLFTLSLLCGVLITAALTWAAFSTENRTVSGLLLWPVTIVSYLLGPGPLLGHNDQGEPMYEGTPVALLILPLGWAFSIASYSAVSYLVLKAKFGVLR